MALCSIKTLIVNKFNILIHGQNISSTSGQAEVISIKPHPLASPEVDKHPGGDEYGVDAHQALHQHQGHTKTLQYH